MKVSSGLALPFCDNRKPKRVQADLSLLLTVDEYNTLGFTITRLFYLNTARANKYQALCVCNVQTNLRVYKKKKEILDDSLPTIGEERIITSLVANARFNFFFFFSLFLEFPFSFFFFWVFCIYLSVTSLHYLFIYLFYLSVSLSFLFLLSWISFFFLSHSFFFHATYESSVFSRCSFIFFFSFFFSFCSSASSSSSSSPPYPGRNRWITNIKEFNGKQCRAFIWRKTK